MARTWFDDFYPTPEALAYEMLSGIDFLKVESVLEPSAGKGDLASVVAQKMSHARYYGEDKHKTQIDCVEVAPELQNALVAKGLRVIHDDFLTLETEKRYDLIAMNPPFAEGDAHLLKALSLVKHGGEIACLLNAETLKNPCTDRRRELARQLGNSGATVKYKQGAFLSAERKTGVEVAIVRVSIPKTVRESSIFAELRQARIVDTPEERVTAKLAENDIGNALIDQFNFETRAGIALIDEFRAVQTLFKADKARDVLELKLGGHEATPNGFLTETRRKYWKTLLESKDMSGVFTSNLLEEYRGDVDRLSEYDFTAYNINVFTGALAAKVASGIEETILAMFDKLSCVYHYDENTSSFRYSGQDHEKNTHYYNGWKTNKAWYINKRVIIPFYGAWGYWGDKFKPNDYKVVRELGDIEKCFNYLDCGRTESIDLMARLKTAEVEEQTKKIDTKYFLVTFYKKGTAHLEFKDLDLLQKFNIFGSQRRGWLPPSYGKTRYKDMDEYARAVVDSFQGEDAYNKVMENRGFFITDTTKFMQLAAADAGKGENHAD